jgi:hypothetical protein
VSPTENPKGWGLLLVQPDSDRMKRKLAEWKKPRGENHSKEPTNQQGQMDDAEYLV